MAMPSKAGDMIYLALSQLQRGGGAEEQILLHLKALRNYAKFSTIIVCSKKSPIKGEGIEARGIVDTLLQRGIFVSYLSRDHMIGFVRKILGRGRWVPFERTHPGFYEAQGEGSVWKRLKHTIQVWIYRFFPDAIFVQTASAQMCWHEKLKIYPLDKIQVIPNIYCSQTEQLFGAGDIPRIVMVGRLIPIKDYPLALTAFAELKKRANFQVEIFGSGHEKNSLEQLAASLGLHEMIKFRGFVSDKKEIYGQATLLVMTSKFEGSPNAIGEAMAYGIPVVTLDFEAGPRDLLGGLDKDQIVESRQPSELADLILKHLANPEWSQNIGRANQLRIASDYSESLFAEAVSRSIMTN